MVRRLLLPLLGFALLATEAATAQTLPPSLAATAAPSKTPAPRPAGRMLTARERRAAEKLAQAEAAKASATLALATPPQAAGWSGWSDEPMPQVASSMKRPTTNLSVAPGMPVNQVGHGVTTDYNGRPLNRTTTTNTTLPSQR